MSDTRKETVTLYIEDPWEEQDYYEAHSPVGEFRRINWCKTHNSAGYDDRCHLAHERWVREADSGFVESGSDCKLVELWQEQP